MLRMRSFLKTAAFLMKYMACKKYFLIRISDVQEAIKAGK